MQSILEELYRGETGFDTQYCGLTSNYADAAKRKSGSMEKLFQTLNEEEKELFERHFEAHTEIEDIKRYHLYVSTLKFAIRLMAEIYAEKPANLYP